MLLVALLAGSHRAGGGSSGGTLGLIAASVLLLLAVHAGSIVALDVTGSLLPDQRTAGGGSGKGELGQGNSLTIDWRSTAISGAGVARSNIGAAVGRGEGSRLVATAISSMVSAIAASIRGDDGLNGQSRLHLVGVASDRGATISSAVSAIRTRRSSSNGANANALGEDNHKLVFRWKGCSSFLGLTMNFIILNWLVDR